MPTAPPPEIRPDLFDITASLYGSAVVIPFSVFDADSNPDGFSASANLFETSIATATIERIDRDNWELTLSPDASGTTPVTITAIDAPGGLSTSKTFDFTVRDFLTPTPGAPSISAINDTTMLAGSTLSIPFFVADYEDTPDQLDTQSLTHNSV